MSGLFDILNDICEDKKRILRKEKDFKGYSQFMINRGLSQHKDTVMVAAYANKLPNMTDQMHYDLMMSLVSKRRRRGRWAKKSNDKSIDIVMKYYNVSEKKALEYLKILDTNDLKILKSKLFTGGTNNRDEN